MKKLLLLFIFALSAQAQQPVIRGLASCGVLDNAICTSAVDASGNPNFLATAANTVLPINGGTTPLAMYISGVYQQLTSNVTLTVPSTASVRQWILAIQDTANSSMVAGDFLAMNTSPVYDWVAPTCPSPSPALSSTNPAFWFDLSTNLSKTCTSNGGAYSANPSMVIGSVWVDATPKVLQVLAEPYRLNPYKRYSPAGTGFGDGSDGDLTISSGTTTIDICKKYRSVTITGTAVLTNSAPTNNTVGVCFSSQSPVMMVGTASITAVGNGRAKVSGTTGTGSGGTNFGRGGAGGGGGGSGTTSAAGGAGAPTLLPMSISATFGAGAAGAITPTAGGNATDNIAEGPRLTYQAGYEGNPGGAGAGDGTHSGGNGGAGSAPIWMFMPAILAISGTSILSTGGAATAGAAANAGGGGGGGAGCMTMNAGYFLTSAATVTAAGGALGASGGGTGTAGGTGGACPIQQNKISF